MSGGYGEVSGMVSDGSQGHQLVHSTIVFLLLHLLCGIHKYSSNEED